MFKEMFKNRALGFYVAFVGACLAVVVSLVYLFAYLSIYSDKMDRVFSIMTLVFVLCGGLVVLCGELLRIEHISLAGPILIAVGLANHTIQAAYPIADIATGVVFFGGNQLFALLFIVLIGVSFLVCLAATFMKHNK